MTSNQIAAAANRIEKQKNDELHERGVETNRLQGEYNAEIARHNQAEEYFSELRLDIEKDKNQIQKDYNAAKLELDRESRDLDLEYKYATFERQAEIETRKNEISEERNRLEERKRIDDWIIGNRNADIADMRAGFDYELGTARVQFEQYKFDKEFDQRVSEYERTLEARWAEIQQRDAQIAVDREELDIKRISANAAKAQAEAAASNAQSNYYATQTERTRLEWEKMKYSEQRWQNMLTAVGSFFRGVSGLAYFLP